MAPPVAPAASVVVPPGSSLMNIARSRILSIISSVHPAQSKWKILVTDPKSIKIINSICKLQEVLDCNVTLIEDISRRRQAYSNKEAVYILSTYPQSVDALINDFSGKKMYAGAHIFFINPLSDELFNKIKSSNAAPFIRSLKEVLINFVPLESRAFSLDEPLSLFTLYNVDPSLVERRLNTLKTLAKRLVSTLATIGEYPYIRYYNASGKAVPAFTEEVIKNLDLKPEEILEIAGHTSSAVAIFARFVQYELDQLRELDDSFPPPSEYGRGVLLITDRTLDMLSPFLHEYTYQAMITDVLKIENGKYMTERDKSAEDTPNLGNSLNSSVAGNAVAAKQKVIIDETDQIFTLIRHWHYVDVTNYIKAAFEDFLSNNKAALGALGKNAELSGIDAIKQMKDTLYALPEFQEIKTKFSTHINICTECSQIFERNGTQNISSIEQDLAMGEHADGTRMKQTSIMMNMLPLLDNNSVPVEDKIRLLLTYAVINDGIEDEERKQLLGYAHLTPVNNQAIINLSFMGVQIGRGVGPNSKVKPMQKGVYKYHSHRNGRNDADAKYDVSRWVPILKSIAEDQLNDTLDTNLFPWAKLPPSVAEAEKRQKEEQQQSVLTKAVTKLNFGRKDASLTPPDPTRPFSLRTSRPTWTKKRADHEDFTKPVGGSTGSPVVELPEFSFIKKEPRLILFVLGGITHSEIRATYELSSKFQKEIYIGGSYLYNPFQYVECLKELHKSDPFGTLPTKWINQPEHKMDVELLDLLEAERENEKLKELEASKTSAKKSIKAKRNEPEPGYIENASKAMNSAKESVSKSFKKTTVLAKIGL